MGHGEFRKSQVILLLQTFSTPSHQTDNNPYILDQNSWSLKLQVDDKNSVFRTDWCKT